MSSNTEKPGRVPKLRFPAFLEAGEWKEEKLLALSNEPLSNGVFNDPKKVGDGYKLINVSDMYIDTVIDEGRLSLLELSQSDFEANQVEHGDIFFTRSSLVKSGIAVSNIYLGSSGDVTFDGHLIRFRANTNKVFPLFAHYLFKTTPARAQLIARGKSATMTTIGQADVASVVLFYPEKEEQQKIADCLASLDERITLEAQQLDTLKVHKKGLMQQLFPAEGETLPKLRFPEFRDAGEWKAKDIGEVFTVTRGEVLSMKLVTDKKTDETPYPVFSSQTKSNGLAGFYSEYLYEDAITWTTDGANAGDVNYRQGKFYCTNVCGVLINKDGYANSCIAALINSVSKKHVSYVGNPKLMNGVMSRIVIPFPWRSSVSSGN
jgi:type I restriction enzyme, S subunit